ncbi:DEAD/DEAH box helicase [Micromonospora sp. NPDC050695]|uniref:DEAD/DEAH box helicase n=1 Tax=Micromonospora sp. NPDC050695 TaxID=3154938 RepID=UPI0033F47FA7
MSTYAEFLARKSRRAGLLGTSCATSDVNPMLHDWQASIVAWAVRKGRAAIWADTGLGKTFMQTEWARLSGGRALIVAPLAVCQQTVREAAKLGVAARYVRTDDGLPGVMVTNYEMALRFDPAAIDAVVLDEASILKQSDGKMRTALIGHFASVPARLACTATPAPNDPEELTNQAEFLGVMPRVEMLAAYFIHDDAGWRLKGHAREPMYRWMTSWAVALRRPSDIGYADAGYSLPPLDIIAEPVHVDIPAPEGQLFAADLGGVGGRASVRKQTLAERVERAAQLVAAEPDEPWVLWCGLNAEAEALAAAIPGAVNVAGNWAPEDKAKAFLDFADGRIRYVITKPSMAAYGLNWQHCARMAFVGLGDSWEQYYQAVRRCWRYGQTRPVRAHVVLSPLEGQIAQNVARKEREVSRLVDGLVAAMRQEWQVAA